jgi:hypothetical protein
MVEHLCNKHEALSSNSSAAQNNSNKKQIEETGKEKTWRGKVAYSDF